MTLRLRGQDVEAFAQAKPDERRCVEGLRRLVEHYSGYSRFLGLKVDGNGRPDEGYILKATRRERVLISVRVA